MYYVGSATRRIARGLTGLARDEAGAILLYVTVMLPVIIGFSLLAVDGSRYIGLNTQLQKAADALAIAAAAELDRRPDAIARAEAAMANLVQNAHVHGNSELANVRLNDARYLRTLPGDDKDPITAVNEVDTTGTLAEQSAEARFVEVTVEPETLNTVLPASFFGGPNQVSTSAQAVAGFTAAVCDFTPLFMCNPFEGSGTSIFEAAEDDSIRKKLIQLRMLGQNADYFPGNFAFLMQDDWGSGANALRDALARVGPGMCFSQDGVDTEPGQNTGPVRQGLNVRFDIYDGPMNSDRNDPDYRPAQNVRKGYLPENNMCNADAGDDNNPDLDRVMGLLRDDCFYAENCEELDESESGGRMGTGTWDFELYWDTNHGNGSEPDYPEDWSNDNLPSRYEVYRYEIDNDLIADKSLGPDEDWEGESGEALCSSSTTSDSPDRRIIYAAIINCLENAPLNGREEDVPVQTFAEFFITEPIPSSGASSGGGSLFVELVRIMEPSGSNDNVVRDIVQLYR